MFTAGLSARHLSFRSTGPSRHQAEAIHRSPSQMADDHRMIKSIIFGAIFFLIATFPATWLLMLFLGNVGINVSYWGTLPVGILVSILLAGATTPGVTVLER
jgi:hypothetical protein